MATRDDEEPATVVGRADGRPVRSANPVANPVESPTRQVESPLSGPTRAMPAGYGMAAFAPPPRPSAPRPAAGRPAVPRIVDDPTSESDMTLIERIDAELESKTAELEIPEGVDAGLFDESSTDGGAGSEATVRLAVPDDLPSDLLDGDSEPGTSPRRPMSAPSLRGGRPPTPMPAPSFSSMPTPPRGTRTEGLFAPPPDPPSPLPAARPDAVSPGSALASAVPSGAIDAGAPPSAAPAAAPSSTARPRAPAPAWVGPYLVVCFVVSLMGVIALTYLKLKRYW